MVELVTDPIPPLRRWQTLAGIVDRAPTEDMTTPPTSIHILIADDDDVDRELIRRLLAQSHLPLRIDEASSAAAALERLADEVPDVVILDRHLSDREGLDLVPVILGDDRESERSCAIIMISGRGDERGVVQALRAGVHDYLPKCGLTRDGLEQSIQASLRWLANERELRDFTRRLTRLGMYDTLTGLPNRNLFYDRLEQARLATARGGATFALLMMDLDFFKEVNDSLGHEAGDQLLREVGRRLRESTRVTDSFARLGGDEFAGLLVGVDSIEGAVAVAEKISASIREPVVIEEQMVSVGVSIGIVLVRDPELEVRTLMCWADQAMYRAKREGRDYEVFTERGDLPEARPLLIAAQLGKALERREIFLNYQPKIDLGTGEVVGLEALARWQSPILGEVPPSEFIPIAERSTLIRQVTHRVLEMAVEQMRIWREVGFEVPVAVNISARALDDDQLAPAVARALAVHAVAANALTFEITETALVSSTSRARGVLRAVADLGVAISIDDFGSGFTSFRYLRELDISEIKVDGLFITHLDDAQRDSSIVRSIAELARGFGVRLVAEGIESEELWPTLRGLGCHIGQGFSIARPMTAADVPEWYRGWIARLASQRRFNRGVTRLNAAEFRRVQSTRGALTTN